MISIDNKREIVEHLEAILPKKSKVQQDWIYRMLETIAEVNSEMVHIMRALSWFFEGRKKTKFIKFKRDLKDKGQTLGRMFKKLRKKIELGAEA